MSSQTQSKSTRIEIRVEPELKEKLETIARIHGVSMSDLVRTAIDTMLIREYVAQYEIIEKVEKAIVKTIVESQQFQDMLKQLEKYVSVVEVCEEWECDKYTTIDGVIAQISCDRYAGITKNNDGKLKPIIWYDCGYDNIYHSKHYYAWCKKDVTSLEELTEWLEAIRQEFEEMVKSKLERIKESIERLIA